MSSQFKMDACVDTYNTALPSTTACPYLPGQAVNTLIVPVEQALRQRSVSMNSMRLTDYTTPGPTPAPITADNDAPFRVGPTPLQDDKSSSRSLSPAPGAWKRFFSRKLVTREGERGRSPVRHQTPPPSSHTDSSITRCTTASEGTRTRDISPESLRRFLSEDPTSGPKSNLTEEHVVAIPADIVEDYDEDYDEDDEDDDEDDNDDDNFASSASAEPPIYGTRLTPPPFKRCASSDYVGVRAVNSRSPTLIPRKPSPKVYEAPGVPASAVIPSRPRLETLSACCASFKTGPNSLHSPVSPDLTEDEGVNFDMTDDDVFKEDDDVFAKPYSLPRLEGDEKNTNQQPTYAKTSPTALLSLNVNDDNFLGAPNATDPDLVNHLGWMATIII